MPAVVVAVMAVIAIVTVMVMVVVDVVVDAVTKNGANMPMKRALWSRTILLKTCKP